MKPFSQPPAMPADPWDTPLDPGLLATEATRSLFSKFRALLEANTAALGVMANMERMLGGEYIFDRTFLENSARDVTDLAHQAVYALNAMTQNRHVALYDRFMTIASRVEDILAGRPGADDDRLVRPFSGLRLEDRPKVGASAAALGELAGQLGLPVPRGLALARAAWNDGALTEAAVAAVRAALEHQIDGPDTATVTVTVGFDGDQHPAGWRETRGVPAQAAPVLAALAGLGKAVWAQRPDPAGAPRLTASITAAPPAVLRGCVQSQWREEDGQTLLRLELWEDGDDANRDAFFLNRSHPFAPRRSKLSAKSFAHRLPDGMTPLGQSPNGFLRGSALLPFETTAALAGQAMAAERLLGAPVELTFCQDAAGTVTFESVRPRLREAAAPAAASAPTEILLRGGEAACLGVVSGMVVPVDETTPPAEFPFGAIAVARSAAPALAPLLRRAGGIVAEVGDAAGHLAAVAREYRTPALFGLPGALTVLAKGLLVTVDAEAGEVRLGATEHHPASDLGLSPDDPEYLTLRRLLRRIAALHLTDPEAPDFSVAGCRTLHDILHFAHDRAVAVLTDLRQTGVSEQLAKPLSLPVPLDLRVLDIGGGLVSGATGLAAVRSKPLHALLSGMLVPGMWDTQPAKVGLGDILGGMEATMAALSGRSGLSGGNLAIAARSYCNVSLRLGYHFTVIDAYLGQNPEKNSIYFRFAGGMANAAGRAARAAFLRRVLDRYDFKVTVAGDLVVARLKCIEPDTAARTLEIVGRLCAFSRQRDTGQPDAAALEAAFFARDDAPGGATGEPL